MRHAVIDLGSNSFRLLLANVDNGLLLPIQDIKLSVKLASGIYSDNMINSSSMQRGINALEDFVKIITQNNCDTFDVVGTMALRSAINASQFIELANDVLDHEVQVLSGIEEAKYIYIGASRSLLTQHNKLIVDIGGGSTELIFGLQDKILNVCSVDIGCLTISEQYFVGDITQTCFNKAVEVFTEKVHNFRRGLQSQLNAYCTSNVIKYLNKICKDYYGGTMTLLILYKIRDDLISNSCLFEIIQDYQSIILGSLAILIAIFEVFGLMHMGFANGALSEGIIYAKY